MIGHYVPCHRHEKIRVMPVMNVLPSISFADEMTRETYSALTLLWFCYYKFYIAELHQRAASVPLLHLSQRVRIEWSKLISPPSKTPQTACYLLPSSDNCLPASNQINLMEREPCIAPTSAVTKSHVQNRQDLLVHLYVANFSLIQY